MPIRAHVPVTVRVTGELSAERRDLLRRAVTRVVAARLAAAERTLAERGYGAREVWPPPGDDPGSSHGGESSSSRGGESSSSRDEPVPPDAGAVVVFESDPDPHLALDL